MARYILCIVLITMPAVLSGCVTAAKQALYSVTGARGHFYEVRVVDPQALGRIGYVRVEPFSNSLGPRVPSRVVTQLDRRIADKLAEAHLFSGSGDELVVRGTVVHFTGKSGLAGSIGSVIGGADVCVCRIQLVDAGTGQSIGEGVCWGEVKSAIRRGSREYGDGVGEGLIRWIRKRLPPRPDRRDSG